MSPVINLDPQPGSHFPLFSGEGRVALPQGRVRVRIRDTCANGLLAYPNPHPALRAKQEQRFAPFPRGEKEQHTSRRAMPALRRSQAHKAGTPVHDFRRMSLLSSKL